MTVLAIDPGLERVGWAVVVRQGSTLSAPAYGLLTTPRVELPERLRLVHAGVNDLLEEHQPNALATERLLFTKNQTTAMDVAKSLGCVLLACAGRELPWAEYSPPEIKKAVTGTGSATKAQVTFMVTRLLALPAPPKPDDVADALAIALTHALRPPTQQP